MERSDSLNNMIQQLDEAVRLGDPNAIANKIKEQLGSICVCTEFQLPDQMTECCPESYARRLLHHCPDLGYTVVVMTWGPGQKTGLHDHAGMWCVECVVEGELDVTQYDLTEAKDDRCRFQEEQTIRASVGDAGCLIPPYEYHVLANARSDRKAVTLHVYGGEMDHCNIYEPGDDGWWARQQRSLSYNA